MGEVRVQRSWVGRVLGLALGLTALVLPAGAHAAPADFDPTFGDNGYVMHWGAESMAMALQPDGRILMAGNTLGCRDDEYGDDLLMRRLLPNGREDPSYGTGGDGVACHDTGYNRNGDVEDAALSPNGRFVVLGVVDGAPNSVTLVALGRDGRPDPTFGGDGVVELTPNPGDYQFAQRLLVQPDNKILFNTVAEISGREEPVVVRLLPNGELDPSFGDGGMAVRASRGMILLQPDGKILSVGTTVSRILSNGSPDPTFAGGGSLTGHTPPGTQLFDAALQADGKIVLAGSLENDDADEDFLVTRLRADGQLDTDFASGGRITIPSGGVNPAYNSNQREARLRSVAVQDDGAIVAAGSAYTWSAEEGYQHLLNVVRLEADGSRDTSFGDNGLRLTGIDGFEPGNSLAIQPDRKILVGGWPQSSVARFLGDYVEPPPVDPPVDPPADPPGSKASPAPKPSTTRSSGQAAPVTPALGFKLSDLRVRRGRGSRLGLWRLRRDDGRPLALSSGGSRVADLRLAFSGAPTARLGVRVDARASRRLGLRIGVYDFAQRRWRLARARALRVSRDRHLDLTFAGRPAALRGPDGRVRVRLIARARRAFTLKVDRATLLPR